MTCIVGLKSNGNVWIGADSLGSEGNYKETYATEKLGKYNIKVKKLDITYPMIYGWCHSYRMGNILRHVFVPPKIGEDQDVENYLVNNFIPKLIDCFDIESFTAIKDNVKEGGTFIIGFASRLFQVQSDFSIVEPALDYTAIGSGMLPALGAMYATMLDDKISDSNRVTTAINAAATFTTGVDKDIKVIFI